MWSSYTITHKDVSVVVQCQHEVHGGGGSKYSDQCLVSLFSMCVIFMYAVVIFPSGGVSNYSRDRLATVLALK